jgi:hypothetical protein
MRLTDSFSVGVDAGSKGAIGVPAHHGIHFMLFLAGSAV